MRTSKVKSEATVPAIVGDDDADGADSVGNAAHAAEQARNSVFSEGGDDAGIEQFPAAAEGDEQDDDDDEEEEEGPFGRILTKAGFSSTFGDDGGVGSKKGKGHCTCGSGGADAAGSGVHCQDSRTKPPPFCLEGAREGRAGGRMAAAAAAAQGSGEDGAIACGRAGGGRDVSSEAQALFGSSDEERWVEMPVRVSRTGTGRQRIGSHRGSESGGTMNGVDFVVVIVVFVLLFFPGRGVGGGASSSTVPCLLLSHFLNTAYLLNTFPREYESLPLVLSAVIFVKQYAAEAAVGFSVCTVY